MFRKVKSNFILKIKNSVNNFVFQFKVLDVPHIQYEEEINLDINKRLMQTRSKPVGFQTYAILEELSSFSPFSNNPAWYKA